MGDDILFQITEEQLESGLRGVPVGYCVTSTVHPEKGLFYAGHSISEVATWEPERVIFLLYKGYDPPAQELNLFKSDLQKRVRCSREAIESIEKLPRRGSPMALYSAAILLAGVFEKTSDYREDCLNLIAKIPELTATFINAHAGWGKTPPSRPELGYMKNFAQMLNLPQKPDPKLSEILTLFNILHYDHGGGNLSVFVGKAVASSLADLYASISAAMDALSGPRHGGANQEALHFVQSMLTTLGENATEKEVEEEIRARLKSGELIYGFGHAVLRVEDPRATVQYDVARKNFAGHPLVKMAFMIRKVGTKVLQENPKIADPYPNVDAISGALLTAAGFPFPEYFTVLFGMSRCVGVAIQILYERLEARGGKGTPILRPKYIYRERSR